MRTKVLGVEHDRAGLYVLSRAEPLALLGSVANGRIAISSRSLPLILPVTFTIDDERILFSTWDGSTLSAATDGNIVAFQADEPCADEPPGWSVSVTGRANHLPLEALPPEFRMPSSHWGQVASMHGVEISTDVISGRRLPAGVVGSAGRHEGTLDPGAWACGGGGS